MPLALYHILATFDAAEEKSLLKTFVEKGQYAGYQHFALFPQFFSTISKVNFIFFFFLPFQREIASCFSNNKIFVCIFFNLVKAKILSSLKGSPQSYLTVPCFNNPEKKAN